MIRSLCILVAALSLSGCGLTLCHQDADCRFDEVCQVLAGAPIGQCVEDASIGCILPRPPDLCAQVTCAGNLGCDPEDGTCRATCGGFLGLTCAADEFCDFGNGYCGGDDSLGFCRARPTSCPPTSACIMADGCDGQQYCSECEARAAGTDVAQFSRYGTK